MFLSFSFIFALILINLFYEIKNSFRCFYCLLYLFHFIGIFVSSFFIHISGISFVIHFMLLLSFSIAFLSLALTPISCCLHLYLQPLSFSSIIYLSTLSINHFKLLSLDIPLNNFNTDQFVQINQLVFPPINNILDTTHFYSPDNSTSTSYNYFLLSNIPSSSNSSIYSPN